MTKPNQTRLSRCLATSAKVNLYLRVVGKRTDGYHEIETVFLPLPGLCDEVAVAPARDGKLSLVCPAPGVPEGPDNLAWRAAIAFAKFADLRPTWRIAIRKRIPVAAGLGGGSSDAGAVLRLLHAAHPILSDEELREIALGLGADVPFFLAPDAAVGTGIGEELVSVTVKRKLPLVVVFPKFPLSTAWAYGHWRPDPSPGALDPLCAALAAGDLAGVAANLANDLAPAAFAKFPILTMLREEMIEAEAMAVGLTGSGPTLFGLCPTPDAARKVGARMTTRFRSAVQVFVVLAG